MYIADSSRSEIVLLGSAAYLDHRLPALPAVAANLRDLSRTLTDPASGLVDPSRCTELLNPDGIRQVGATLRDRARRAEDLLLVYYAGHGLIAPSGQDLYLAMPDTDPTDPMFSSLPYEWIRTAVRDSPARLKVIVLDCCYSGRALNGTMAIQDGDAVPPALVEVAGSCLLTATSANVAAIAPQHARHTAFTGALLSVLAEARAEPAPLTLAETYRRLLLRCESGGLPRPQRVGTANADDLILARPAVSAPAPPARMSVPVEQQLAVAPPSPSADSGNPEWDLHRAEPGNDGERIVFRQKRIRNLIWVPPLLVGGVALIGASADRPTYADGTTRTAGDSPTDRLDSVLMLGVGAAILILAICLLRQVIWPLRLEIGKTGIQIYSIRGPLWLPWNRITQLRRVEGRRGEVLVVHFPNADQLSATRSWGPPRFEPRLGGLVLFYRRSFEGQDRRILATLELFGRHHGVPVHAPWPQTPGGSPDWLSQVLSWYRRASK